MIPVAAAYSKLNPDPPDRAYTAAYAKLRQNDCNEADSDFSKLIVRDPDDARAWSGRGAARLCLNKYDDAIADYTHAAKVKPEWFDYLGMALAQKAKGDPAQATASLDKAIALNPKVPVLYIYRGALAESQGRKELAHQDVQRVTHLVSAWPRRMNYYAWVLATSPVDAYRDGPGAVIYATRACEATKWNQSWELDTLAAAYARDGKFDEAIRWQSAALKIASGQEVKEYQERLALYQKHEPYVATHLLMWF